ncbi:MAG: helix-turn-helix transcriptional regulator [Marinilabiliaceae bacterium]|nr:helix-turn-helix transcriptional regulator [Marinilabiliaceae bacterium]
MLQEIVKSLLKERKKTMQDLANAVGLTQLGLSLLLKRENPSMSKVSEIAKYLGVSVAVLYGEETKCSSSYIVCPDCGRVIAVSLIPR